MDGVGRLEPNLRNEKIWLSQIQWYFNGYLHWNQWQAHRFKWRAFAIVMMLFSKFSNLKLSWFPQSMKENVIVSFTYGVPSEKKLNLQTSCPSLCFIYSKTKCSEKGAEDCYLSWNNRFWSLSLHQWCQQNTFTHANTHATTLAIKHACARKKLGLNGSSNVIGVPL